MRSALESDVGFYYVVGAFTIAIFAVSLLGIAIVGPAGIGTRALGGLVGGFLLFMLVYFVSILANRLEDLEDV